MRRVSAHRRWRFAPLAFAATILGSSPVAASSPVSAGASIQGQAQAQGTVLETVNLASFKDPWYVWDKAGCKFVQTTTHPDTYVARLRSTPGMKLVYTPEATGDSFDDTLNASIKAAADRAGAQFFQFSNEYPSTTLPLQNVDQANSVQADVVISGNVQGDQYPQIQQKYQQYCIPFLNQYAVAGTTDIPMFQGDNYGTGTSMAQAAAAIIQQRGWPTADTWIVTCADPNQTPAPGTVYDIDKGYRETLASSLGIPAEHVAAPDLVCTSTGGVDGARSAMADWITAHPQAHYVTAVAHIDELYGIGMAKALQDANFGDTALVAARGGGDITLKQIAAGDPIIAVDGDPLFSRWGTPIVAMAQDIAQGLPVPFLASPPVIAVTKDNASQYIGQ